MTIVELFAHVGFKADHEKADRFLGTVKGIKIGLAAAAAGATAFTFAVKKITDEAFQSALEIKKLQDSTGASAESLQRWQAVADQVSGSGQAVAASIRAIASNQEKIKLGGGNISAFQMLGIDPRSDPFAVLEQLRTKTQGLSQAMKRNIMEQMGVSGDLISTLELTNEQFSSMAKKAWIIPQSQIDGLNKARSSLVEVGQAIKYMKALIATQLAPKILEITKRSLEWVRANKEGLVKWISKVFDLISRFVVAIFRAGSMISTLVTNTIGWKNALIGVVALLGIMNASFLASPLGLFIAGIVLLVAVLDDLYVYSKGGKSLFGTMLEKFPELKKVLDSTFKVFTDIKEVISNIVKIFDLMGKGQDDAAAKIAEKAGTAGKVAMGAAGAGRTFLQGMNMLGNAGVAAVTGDASGLKASIDRLAEGSENFLATLGVKDLNLPRFGPQPQPAAAGNVTINQNVYGTNDAEATGKAAAKELERALQGTKVQRSAGNKGMK
jgi:hypothetical protein